VISTCSSSSFMLTPSLDPTVRQACSSDAAGARVWTVTPHDGVHVTQGAARRAPRSTRRVRSHLRLGGPLARLAHLTPVIGKFGFMA
jgi:hypothetical protein